MFHSLSYWIVITIAQVLHKLPDTKNEILLRYVSDFKTAALNYNGKFTVTEDKMIFDFRSIFPIDYPAPVVASFSAMDRALYSENDKLLLAVFFRSDINLGVRLIMNNSLYFLLKRSAGYSEKSQKRLDTTKYIMQSVGNLTSSARNWIWQSILESPNLQLHWNDDYLSLSTDENSCFFRFDTSEYTDSVLESTILKSRAVILLMIRIVVISSKRVNSKHPSVPYGFPKLDFLVHNQDSFNLPQIINLNNLVDVSQNAVMAAQLDSLQCPTDV